MITRKMTIKCRYCHINVGVVKLFEVPLSIISYFQSIIHNGHAGAMSYLCGE